MDLSSYVCKTSSCPAFGDWALANELKVNWGEHRAGDIVLYDFNHNETSDHIGIVVKVGNGYIDVVEGNTGNGSDTNGDGVYIRRRYKSQVNYFVRSRVPERFIPSLIATAKAEVGYKEGKKNSNKYGKAFGQDNVSWCCIFVWWVFKNCKVSASTGKALFIKGKTYTVVAESGLNVRKGPGTKYNKVAYVNLSKDGKKHSLSKKHGCFKKGTVITALEVKGNWVRCPSGWLCGKEGNNLYLK